MKNPEADDVYCETFCCLLSGFIIIDLKFFSALSCYMTAMYVGNGKT